MYMVKKRKQKGVFDQFSLNSYSLKVTVKIVLQKMTQPEHRRGIKPKIVLRKVIM